MDMRSLTKNQLLAYETGLHLGDGCLYINPAHRTYRYELSGDSVNDYEFYSQIVPRLLELLYKRTPKVYLKRGERTVLVVLNSKEVAASKLALGLPAGNKLKLERVPALIEADLVSHFIRGLADSDFSVTFKRNRAGKPCEPRIEFFTNNEVLAQFVQRKLKLFGFRPSLERAERRGFTEYRLRMYGVGMLRDWMHKIGFWNPKHMSKVEVFERLGWCPAGWTTAQRKSLLTLFPNG